MIAPRERNPERSRSRILDAALEEFAEKGYAGARVEAIARRAGLNKQLISHHFGGKEGLYEAVMDARLARPGGELTAGRVDLAMLFERAAVDQQWVRILLWEALEASGGDRTDDSRRERYAQRVAWIREEQEVGNLPADLDPEMLLLSLFGAACYPVFVPKVAELVTGLTPDGRTFRRRYKAHLVKLAGHLGTRRP